MTPTELIFVSCVRQVLKRIYEPRIEPAWSDGSQLRLSLFEMLERCDADTASKASATGATIAAHVHALSTSLQDVNESFMNEPGRLHDQTSWSNPVSDAEWREIHSNLKSEYHQLQGWLSIEFNSFFPISEAYLFELGLGLVSQASYHLGTLEQLLGTQSWR